jgi:hypothetical protein
VFSADGSGEKSAGKRTVRGRFFGSNLVKRPDFKARKRIFPVIFRGQISRCGKFGGGKFSTGIDSMELRNNLQGLRESLYPRGV